MGEGGYVVKFTTTENRVLRLYDQTYKPAKAEARRLRVPLVRLMDTALKAFLQMDPGYRERLAVDGVRKGGE